MLNRRSRVAAIVVVAISLLVSACSSSKSNADSPQGSSAVRATPPGKPIKLMVETGITGPASNYPELPVGAKAAAKAINAAGGVKDPAGGPNRPIEILVCDDRNDPNTGAECGRKAVDEGVLAMVGNETVTGGAYLPIIAKAGIPVVAELALSQPEFTSKLSFPLTNVFTLSYGLQALARSIGATELNSVSTDLPAVTAFLPEIEAFGKSIGITTYKRTLIPPGATDFTSYAAKAAAGSGAITIGLSGANGVKFLNALINQGVDLTKRPVLIQGDLFGSLAQLQGGAKSAEGLYSSGIAWPATWIRESGVKKYNDEVDAFGDRSTARDGLGAQAWVGVHIIADLLAKAPTITSAGLVTALNAAGPLSYSPLVPFDWSHVAVAAGALSKMRTFSAKVMVSRVVNGKFVPIVDEFVPSNTTFNVVKR